MKTFRMKNDGNRWYFQNLRKIDEEVLYKEVQNLFNEDDRIKLHTKKLLPYSNEIPGTLGIKNFIL